MAYNGFHGNTYFWRNRNQVEIDYLEEQDGTVNVFELKMEFKSTLSRSIYRNLPSKTMAVIHPENYWEWLE